MAFVEVQFPTDIEYGFTGGSKFSTRILPAASGYEQRLANWTKARLRYNLSKGVQDQTLIDAVIAFFNARQGRAHGFRFKDWTDYKITAQAIGTGTPGGLLTFQIYKRYSSGGVNYDRTIKKIVATSVSVTVNAVAKIEGANPGGDYTVNYNTGLITFNAGKAPGNGLSVAVTCEFDVPVRFDTDELNVAQDAFENYSIADLPIIEVRI